MIKIEKMTIDDYEEMLSLWMNTPGIGLSRADSRDGIKRFLDANPRLNYVCTEMGRIIGTVMCGFDGRRGYLYHLVVDQAYRNRGIGKALVNKCLDELKAIGAGKCHLFVFRDNDLGQAFWQKTGWNKRDDIDIYSIDI